MIGTRTRPVDPAFNPCRRPNVLPGTAQGQIAHWFGRTEVAAAAAPGLDRKTPTPCPDQSDCRLDGGVVPWPIRLRP